MLAFYYPNIYHNLKMSLATAGHSELLYRAKFSNGCLVALRELAQDYPPNFYTWVGNSWRPDGAGTEMFAQFEQYRTMDLDGGGHRFTRLFPWSITVAPADQAKLNELCKLIWVKANKDPNLEDMW